MILAFFFLLKMLNNLKNKKTITQSERCPEMRFDEGVKKKKVVKKKMLQVLNVPLSRQVVLILFVSGGNVWVLMFLFM